MPAADVAIVHPHQSLMLEWVAVSVGQRPLRRGTDMREDEVRACLRSQTLQVLTVPGWKCRGEYAGLWT